MNQYSTDMGTLQKPLFELLVEQFIDMYMQ